MKRLIFILLPWISAVPWLLTSCTLQELVPVSEREDVKEGMVRVTLNPVLPQQSKGAIEYNINPDFHVISLDAFVYDAAGTLFCRACEASSDVGGVSMELYEDSEYTIYLLANTDVPDPPQREEDIKDYVLEYLEIEDMVRYEALPMAAVAEVNTSESLCYEVELLRLAAEIDLNFDCPEGFTIELSSVHFRSVPMTVTPFADNTEPLIRSDGDYNILDDCLLLQNGSAVAFYMPEDMSSSNAQPPASGVPGSDEKSPGGVPYIEITGKIFNTAGVATADISYYLYLDYQIKRNNRYQVRFSVTEGGIFEVSYRVDVSQAELALDEYDIVMFVGQTTQLTTAAAAYDALKFTSNKPSVLRVDAQTGDLLALSKGVATVSVFSPTLGCETECTVEVHDMSEDNISIGDVSGLYAAQQVQVPFTADFGGNLIISTESSGVKELITVKVDKNGQPQSVGNDYIEVSFDPASYSSSSSSSSSASPIFTLTAKAPCRVNMILNSISGKTISDAFKVSDPEISVELYENILYEYERSFFFTKMIDSTGVAMSRSDFVEELYDEYYGEIAVSVDEPGRAAIYLYNPTKGGGVVVPDEPVTSPTYETVAHISAYYTGTCEYRASQAAELTIWATFRDLPESLTAQNKIFVSDDATSVYSYPTKIRNLPLCDEVRVRRLKWDGLWENGTDVTDTELTALVENYTSDMNHLEVDFGTEGCGLYMVRFVKKNKTTQKEYYRDVPMYVYLMLECAPHVEYTEGGAFTCDVEMIWNLHPLAAYSALVKAFPSTESEKYIKFSYTGDPNVTTLPAAVRSYHIGAVIKSWVPYTVFNKARAADYDATDCEIFKSCTKSYSVSLYDPFNKKDAGTCFYTDRAFSEKYYGTEKTYLFGVQLHTPKGLMRSIRHYCDKKGEVYETELYGQSD